MKIFGAIALLLILSVGVWIKSLSPAPSVQARDAIGILSSSESTSYYESGLGPTVTMVASAGREPSDFNELAITLNEERYRTISVVGPYLYPGKTPPDLNLEFFSAPILNIIRNNSNTQNNGSNVIIGHAFGNRVTRMTAHQNPDNVSAVILLAAGGQAPLEPKADAALKRIFNPLKSYRSRMKDVRYTFFAEGNETPDYWKRGWHTRAALKQGAAVAGSAGDDSWHCAGGVPMLIVQPMQDKIAPPENAYALRDKCPQDVEIVEVQNAGHALLPEQPEAVAKAVLDFLAKHHPVQ